MTLQTSLVRLPLACAAMGAALAAFAQPVTRTIPAQPRAQEEFVIVYRESAPSSPSKMLDSRATVQPGRIDVQARAELGDFSAASAYDVLAVATVPTAGTYSVNGYTAFVGWGASDPAVAGAPAPRGSVTVGAAVPATAPQWRSLGGLFARPDESGWGLHVAQGSSGRLFVTWYTYDDDYGSSDNRAPNAWYVVAGGKWISPQEFRGVVYDTTGVPAGRPHEPRHSFARAAGVATFRFIDEDRVEFSVEFAQPSRYQTPQVLTRYRF